MSIFDTSARKTVLICISIYSKGCRNEDGGELKGPRGRSKLRWKDTVRRDLKAWKIKEEWATDRKRWKGLCKTRYPEQGDGGERREGE